jgi:hypothetical protein
MYAGKSQAFNNAPVNFYNNSKSTYQVGLTVDNLSSTPSYINQYNQQIVLKGLTWKDVFRETRIGSGRQDELNLSPIFQLDKDKKKWTGYITANGVTFNTNDLVNFNIRAIDGTDPSKNNWMIFRAYLTQFSDGVDAKWNSVNYAGRGEDFYIYNGFSRKINIGFKVAALSAEEMKPMYQKLNYLMGNLMPDYNGILMRGPLVKMTVGNWLNGQDGILNSLSYTIPQDSPWEVNMLDSQVNTPGALDMMVLPHVIEVQMTFTPIGSQTKGDNKISQKDFNTSHIAQAKDGEGETPQYITGSILGGKISDKPVYDAPFVTATQESAADPDLYPFGLEFANVTNTC